jgi:hypothetical protein
VGGGAEDRNGPGLGNSVHIRDGLQTGGDFAANVTGQAR